MLEFRQFHFKLILWVGLLAIALFPGSSSAEDLSKLCAEAHSLLNQIQPQTAERVMRKVLGEVCNRTSLSVAKAVLVKDNAIQYGKYEPRLDNVYKSGETIRIYLEPVGFAVKKQEDHNLIALASDFRMVKEDGWIIIGKENMGKWEWKVKDAPGHIFLNLDYTIRDVKPGKYVIKTVLRDLGNSNSALINTPLRIE